MLSPIRVVVRQDAESTAVCQMNKSASTLHAWFEIPGLKSMVLELCTGHEHEFLLFLLLAKIGSAFCLSFRSILPTNFTFTPTTPPDHRR